MTMLQRFEAGGCGCDAPQGINAPVGIDEALRRIAAATSPVEGAARIPLEGAFGRILDRPVLCRAMAPPFDNAAMDGYALNARALAGNGPWTLPVCARVPAGTVPEAALGCGTTARIFTGAPVPEGADAVIMQEHVARHDDTIRIRHRPAPGLNIRRAGSDIAAGATVLEAGQRLGPRQIAACAAAGATEVHVRRRLRVALLVTGDEVRRVGADLAGAQIRDVNTPMLRAALSDPCIDLIDVSQGADSRPGLERRLAELGQTADLIVTTGGISVGDEDHVKPALRRLGADIRFSGVAIKPGKPVSFGHLGQAAWLGLPGNPLSAFVTWHVFGPALLRGLSGEAGPGQPRRHVATARPIRRKPGRCELRAGRIVGFDPLGREVVDFDDATSSSRVTGLPEADGLIFLPNETDALPKGALVEFQPFGPI